MSDNNFEVKLAILADILIKKKDALQAILNICENQENLYSTPSTPERRDFLVQMGKEKQVQIDEVLACDEMFQGIFNSISENFQELGKEYKERVLTLQTGISEVMEMDVKIRIQEDKTKTAAQEAWGKMAKTSSSAAKEITPLNKNYIIDQYNKNRRK
ncbi:MAG: hypothetical protein FWC67_00330 [Defluviitaleaceae bacterium]|nr:hypothetical protein [Defluviitaleaceae bacterium]